MIEIPFAPSLCMPAVHATAIQRAASPYGGGGGIQRAASPLWRSGHPARPFSVCRRHAAVCLALRRSDSSA
ncbi:hypothetical protein NUW54_g9471 [Trametes sanguinea]|uniref:Uncharacterized protein n=1 Tax=Trametes sanguinea TaxID=158606 RepID=A0ACC1P700_9APHY|nr:hypothetical protein NUW54_g9471 [Trametes sanguinea]